MCVCILSFSFFFCLFFFFFPTWPMGELLEGGRSSMSGAKSAARLPKDLAQHVTTDPSRVDVDRSAQHVAGDGKGRQTEMPVVNSQSSTDLGRAHHHVVLACPSTGLVTVSVWRSALVQDHARYALDMAPV